MSEAIHEYASLERALRRLSIQLVDDLQSLRNGYPAPLIFLLRRLLFDASTTVSRRFRLRGCGSSVNDREFVIALFDFARDELHVPVQISPDQFFQQGYANYKLRLAVAVVEFVIRTDRQAAHSPVWGTTKRLDVNAVPVSSFVADPNHAVSHQMSVKSDTVPTRTDRLASMDLSASTASRRSIYKSPKVTRKQAESRVSHTPSNATHGMDSVITTVAPAASSETLGLTMSKLGGTISSDGTLRPGYPRRSEVSKEQVGYSPMPPQTPDTNSWSHVTNPTGLNSPLRQLNLSSPESSPLRQSDSNYVHGEREKTLDKVASVGANAPPNAVVVPDDDQQENPTMITLSLVDLDTIVERRVREEVSRQWTTIMADVTERYDNIVHKFVSSIDDELLIVSNRLRSLENVLLTMPQDRLS